MTGVLLGGGGGDGGGGGGGPGGVGGGGGGPGENPESPATPAVASRTRVIPAELEKERDDDGIEPAPELSPGEASEKLKELRARLEEAQRELAAAREALDASERRRTIERELVDAEAIDLETATLLTEVAVEQMDEPDVALVVADLKRRKPFLFTRPQLFGGAMAAASEGGGSTLVRSAEEARTYGDRRALLRYLRLRRGAN